MELVSAAPEVPLPESPVEEPRTPKKLFVSNLNFKVRKAEIEPLFASIGTLVSCEVQMLSDTMSRGYALVEYADEDDCQKAIDLLNGQELMERPMNVRLDLDRAERPQRAREPRVYEARQPQNPEFFKRRAPSYGKQLFVGNLSFRTSWQDLKDEFRSVGNVVRAEVFTTNVQGFRKSKGCGIVVMETEEDARRAVEIKNGIELDKREIVVRMDAPPEDRPNYVSTQSPVSPQE